MLNYEEFKTALMGELPAYLPAKYRDWEVCCCEVVKVNGIYDAIHVTPPAGQGGSPTLYVHEFFDCYREDGDLERVCRKAVSVFVVGMDYLSRMNIQSVTELPKDRIVFVLVPQKGNQRLLEGVPHRLMLDLAVIYRMVLETEDNGINSAIISRDMAEELDLCEEDLYRLAMANTPKIMPLELQNVEDSLFILTNEFYLAGASTMLYPGVLGNLAEELDSDLYILPCSLQEVFVVPVTGQNVEKLNAAIASANETLIGKEEILADHVYYYRRATDQISIPR